MGTLRSIESRHRGVRHGPITRLISPAELGERLKPFVFLDYFSGDVQPGFGFGMHPHSGIATLTWQPGCDVLYEDTTGKHGVLKAGGLEWMLSGAGAWHQGQLMARGHAIGFQLWVPMPPGVENGPSLGQYVPPDSVPLLDIPQGRVRLLLGRMEGHSGQIASPIHSHQDMNYFVVDLDPNTEWEYSVPATHEIAWAFVFQGAGRLQRVASQLELMVLGDAGAICVGADETPVRAIVGSGRRHPYPLVLGQSSIHTSEADLRRGEAEIERIGRVLREQRRIS
jgi:redox-sensitive bicupin YhaK (pirin superfamily)